MVHVKKKKLGTIVLLTIGLGGNWQMVAKSPTMNVPAVRCSRNRPDAVPKAFILEDSDGKVICADSADVRIEPASLTKLMTAYLVFKAEQEGRIRMTDTLVVSPMAAKQRGSTVLLRQGEHLTLREGIEALLVASGNDSALVLAEHVSGKETTFVEEMNLEAARMGLGATHYSNCSGLSQPGNYSSVADLARLSIRLWSDFPDHRAVFAQKEFAHRGVRHPNRNVLLRLDPRVDGLKTGHTESAGFNLAFTARMDTRRVFGVLVGTNSEGTRVQFGRTMLAIAFPGDQGFGAASRLPRVKAAS